jgi:hypothetical protein
MRTPRHRKATLLLAGCISLVWLATAAAAPANSKPPSGNRKLPAKVSFIDAPSSESAQAREKRLKRECKGRPNAGMCLGHTR